MEKPTVVSVEDVSFSYENVPVLENVRFRVYDGDFTVMVGPNGGGKTTLLKLILGLLKPSSGTVRLLGSPPEKTRERVGYMPQYQRFDLQFPVTVTDVVLMGRIKRGAFGPYPKTDREHARKALGEVGLSGLEKRSFSALSGGQRQRVLLARALVSEPDILLLDEPTANVDTEAETRLLGILETLNRRMTVLLVTHDLGFVSASSGNCICVNRRVFLHPTAELDGEALRKLYGHDIRVVRHDVIGSPFRGQDDRNPGIQNDETEGRNG
ncbi:MAG: ABC transporter ATP-binding protein [Spirochaetes bacterium]|nr:ABC transporter ATP-binding protein [Spirochaetota bacterium]